MQYKDKVKIRVKRHLRNWMGTEHAVQDKSLKYPCVCVCVCVSLMRHTGRNPYDLWAQGLLIWPANRMVPERRTGSDFTVRTFSYYRFITMKQMWVCDWFVCVCTCRIVSDEKQEWPVHGHPWRRRSGMQDCSWNERERLLGSWSLVKGDCELQTISDFKNIYDTETYLWRQRLWFHPHWPLSWLSEGLWTRKQTPNLLHTQTYT